MGKLASGQDTFKALLRDEVAPFLRGHGLKGSGQNFRLPDPGGNLGLVNFQKSNGNFGNRVRFYVNLSTISSALWNWQVAYGYRLSREAPKEYHGHFRNRLESLLPPDHRFRSGWEVGGDDVRAELLGAFGTLGLPWLREHLTDEAMRDTWLASIGDDVTLRGRVDWDNGCLLVVLLRQEDRHDEAARLLGRLRSHAEAMPDRQRPSALERVAALERD
jgi:hypothetical protein